MKREIPALTQKNTVAKGWSAILSVAVVALFAGSAFGALASTTPISKYGDPFGGDEILKGFEDDFPIIGGDDTPIDDGFDYRAHSDVPDLPDSDGDSQENILFIGGSYPEPSWYPQDSGLDFQTIFAPLTGFEDHVAPSLVTPSPVPAPGGIGVLGVLATVVAARRRR